MKEVWMGSKFSHRDSGDMASEPQVLEGTKSFQGVMGGEPETYIESGDRLFKFQNLVEDIGPSSKGFDSRQ